MFFEKQYFAVTVFVSLVKFIVLQNRNNRVGCFYDGFDDDRILQGQMKDLDPNGSEECKKFCEGYRYFGTESGEECFCGNEITNYMCLQYSECKEECEGNHDEFCGDCVTNPCKNGATCENIGSEKYICNCTEGWEGDTCEQDKRESSPNETSQSPNHTTSRTSITAISIQTTTYSQMNLSADDEEKPKGPLMYVLLTVIAVVTVVSLIVIFVICKRRNISRKASNVETLDDVNYITPYSAAYSIPEKETKAENQNKLLPSSGNVNQCYDVSRGDADVNEIELEDYNVINLRSNNGTIVDNSYDHVGHFTPCSKDNNNSTYNNMKVSRNTNLERNGSKAEFSNLYDQTDAGFPDNNSIEYTMYNERKDLPNGADEKDGDNAEENVYLNDEYRCDVKATKS